jgi:hypothetical protein
MVKRVHLEETDRPAKEAGTDKEEDIGGNDKEDGDIFMRAVSEQQDRHS